MIFKKGNMWKVSGSSQKYFTEEEAKAAAGIRETVIKEAIENWDNKKLKRKHNNGPE